MHAHNASPGTTLPTQQRNAWLDPGLVMRVGIPQKSGKIAFHAFTEGYPTMVSANAFWNTAKKQFVLPEASDLYETPFALDSAGFVAHLMFKKKGPQEGMAGIYPWSYQQYIELAGLLQPDWWSQPDLATEDGIAGNQEEIDYRIDATATLLEGTLRIVYAWQNELARTESATTVQNMLKPPVPIIQGRTVSDYLRSLDLLMGVWERWQPWLAAPALIGIGSVCRRHLQDPKDGLYAILKGLDGRLPTGSKVHLFGVKGTALEEVQKLDWVASADSLAWDYGARVKACKGGYSNTNHHRQSEMTRWMQSASRRIAERPQLRLAL